VARVLNACCGTDREKLLPIDAECFSVSNCDSTRPIGLSHNRRWAVARTMNHRSSRIESMTYQYWLPLSLAAVVGSSLALACSSKFDSCEARRTCSPAGGSSGAGGDAGASAGEGATEEGGNAGVSSGAVGGSTGESGGDAGSGGEGGALDVPPALFDDCSTKGAFACVEQAHAQRLACDGKVWQAGTTCGAGELCDSSNGACVPTVPECAASKPGTVVCRGNILLTCGPDLVTAREEKTCAGLCKLGVCQAPICGDAKVEEGEDCDDPDATASGACVKCKTATCGDGAVYAPKDEQCDDGNKASGDGCSATCRDEPVQLALGDAFTCARSKMGLVKCWGGNYSGQIDLVDTNTRVDATIPVPSELRAIALGAGRKAASISARASSVCALLDSGDVKCWGNNDYGQLGTGDTDHRGDQAGEMGDALNPIQLGGGAKASGISVGGLHTCALLSDGHVKCWGSNSRGQLGQENINSEPSPKDLPAIKLRGLATAISASSWHGGGKQADEGGATCALLKDGTVQCWGSTTVVPHASSSDIDNSYGIGDSDGEMGNMLPVLTFSGGRPANSIVAGSVSGALLDDGTLRLWGNELIALANSTDTSTPALLASVPEMPMGKKVKSIATFGQHACAILEDMAVKCWGNGSYGVLGLGSTSVTGSAAPKDVPSVYLGGHGAQQVATSGTHTCAILDDGTLKCWGYNGYGQLGLGDTKNRGDTGDKLSADTTVSLSF